MLNKKQKMRRQFCNAIAIVPAHFYTRGVTVRNKNLFRCIFLLLFAISFIIFSFRDRLHSETDTSGVLLETNPRGIAINPITNIAVIANENADSVSIVDLDTQTFLSTITVGKAPRGVGIDKGFNLAAVGNSHDNTLSVIDLNTFQLISTIPVGKEPEGIAIDSSTHRAYVANHKDGTISVIDLTNSNPIITIPVGQEPKDVAIDATPESNSGVALVVNEKDNDASIIDLNTNQVTNTITVGQKPQAININPETHFAAVVNEKDNSITIIDLQTWQTSTIHIGKHPIDIAINPLDNRAIVICDEDRSLLLIDLDTQLIVKEYALNKLPKGIAVNNFTNVAGVVDDKTDSLTSIQLPNPIPEITSITPDNALRGSNDIKIDIEGSRFITSSIAYFDNHPLPTTFADNHHLHATISGEMLSRAGAIALTVVNPLPEGGTSNSINFMINNPPPTITALDPAEAVAGTSGLTVLINGTGFFEDTEVFFSGVKKLATYISNTQLQMWLSAEDLKTPGQYEIFAHNLPPGGGNSNKASFKVKNPIEIKITSPPDGETINKAKIMVKGTIKSDTKDVGVKVNGILAEIKGSEWIANNVPLTIGSNTITATATDSYGNTDMKTITVYTNDITQLVELSANITSGIAPLQVFFTASTSISPASYQMDFEGDGIIDYTGATFEDISHTYTTEGIFYPTLTVTDNQGNIYFDTIAITVLNKTEMDFLLKGKWEGMKEAILTQNIEKTLAYFLKTSQERYCYIFTNLLSSLPDIATNMQAIEMISTEDGVAEYRIKRLEDVGELTYYIYFVLDENGLWKIQQF